MKAPPADYFPLTIEIVRAIHAEALRQFGGLKGVRDEHLLASAVLMPQSSFYRWEQADCDDVRDYLSPLEWIRAGPGQ